MCCPQRSQYIIISLPLIHSNSEILQYNAIYKEELEGLKKESEDGRITHIWKKA